MRKAWYDWFFVLMFSLFAFVALYYEPAFVSQCGWEGLAQGEAGPCGQTWVGRAWLGYLAIEPLYANAPTWIRLVNEFDIYLFGWFYVLSLFAFFTNRHLTLWYRNIATFVSGMMIYSIILYVTWQISTHQDTGANLTTVILYNGPWGVVPVLLLLRLYAGNRGTH